MGINSGHTYNLGTIWDTCSDDDSVRVLYLETKQIHTRNSNERVRPRFQEVGRYYYKTNRPTKENTDGTTTT